METGYDKVGNVISVKDKRGIVTASTYDDLYRLKTVSRAGVTPVTKEYDDNGNLTAETDAENHRTEHTYMPGTWKPERCMRITLPSP